MKVYNFLLLAVIFLTMSTCSSASKNNSDLTLTVTITQNPTQDSWHVKYETSQPVKLLTFNRQINRFRGKNWKSLTSHIVIKEIDKKEAILSINNHSFTTAEFEFDSYYELTPKDYEFFQKFTDGSVVMYTGHYNACADDDDCEKPVRFNINARKNNKIIILGNISKENATWTESTPRGTYIYIGNIKPLEKKHLTAIIDPVIPSWLKSRLLKTLPQLFDLYTKQTGYNLTFKPFIFLNYSTKGNGTKSHGGTLPGLIQMSLAGKGWRNENQDSFIDLARFLAHESAHIWNGQLFAYESNDMWMHEGGADGFAYLALYQLGIIDKSRFNEFQTFALNDCLDRLKNRPLNEVKEDPNYKAHYRCGSILALITHAASIKNNKSNLFQFWNKLFTRMKNSGKSTYSEDMYFQTLDETTKNSDLSRGFKSFIHGPIKDPKQFLMNTFTHWDIKYKSMANHLPKEYQRTFAMNSVRLLMRKDCDNRNSLTVSRDGIATDAIKGCRTFHSPYLVTKIGDYSLSTQGAQAYDWIRSHCLNSKTLTLTVKENQAPLALLCPDVIPERSTPIQILKVPF